MLEEWWLLMTSDVELLPTGLHKPLRITISIVPTNTADSNWNVLAFHRDMPFNNAQDYAAAVQFLEDRIAILRSWRPQAEV